VTFDRPGPRAHVIATTTLALLVAAFATRAPALLAAYVLAAIALILMGMRTLSALGGRELVAASLLATAVIVALPVVVLRNFNVAFHAITVAVSFGAAYVLTRNLKVYVMASRVTLIAAQAYVVAYLSRSGLEDFPLENMLPDSSSNGVTSYLVVLQANACAGLYLLRRRAAIPTSLLTLGICIVGYGRGSVLAAAGILAVCALFAASGRSLRGAVLGVVLVVASGLAVYVSHEEIIRDYLGKIDGAWPLLFGADYRGTSVETSYFGNPHNSFIRAHNIFGLPYLLCVLALPLLLDRGRWPARERVFVYAMLTLVLARSFTEPLLFPTFFDLYYFALCFALAGRGETTLAPTAQTRPVPS
jgi:hypothetical protein